MRLKLLIADDHELMLEGIRMALADSPDIEIVGSTTSGSQVLPLVRQTSPDVVLLDLRMPGMDGLRCLEALRERYPNVKAVVLSGSEEPDVIEAAFRRGAVGFIVKRIDPADLAAMIRQVVDGNVYYPLEARAAGHRGRRPRADPARGRHLEGACRRPVQQADRPPVLALRADDQVPPHQHLPQARRRKPDGGRPPRLRARSDREPAAPRDAVRLIRVSPPPSPSRFHSGRSTTSTPCATSHARRKKRSSYHSSAALVACRWTTRQTRSSTARVMQPLAASCATRSGKSPGCAISTVTPMSTSFSANRIRQAPEERLTSAGRSGGPVRPRRAPPEPPPNLSDEDGIALVLALETLLTRTNLYLRGRRSPSAPLTTNTSGTSTTGPNVPEITVRRARPGLPDRRPRTASRSTVTLTSACQGPRRSTTLPTSDSLGMDRRSSSGRAPAATDTSASHLLLAQRASATSAATIYEPNALRPLRGRKSGTANLAPLTGCVHHQPRRHDLQLRRIGVRLRRRDVLGE